MATIKSFTDLSQSKHLAEILPLESADMWYSIVDNEAFICLEHHNEYEQIPCWSLAALLELMPYFITIKEEGEPDEYYHFQLNRNGSVFRSKWRASYHGLKTERGKVHTRIIHWAVGPNGESDTPIDAAFEMVCWLIEQGYIKVNK